MTKEEIQALFAKQQDMFQHRLDVAVQALADAATPQTEIMRQSEERCRFANERTEARETAYENRCKQTDERNARAEERSERQVIAWERIAAAIERACDDKGK